MIDQRDEKVKHYPDWMKTMKVVGWTSIENDREVLDMVIYDPSNPDYCQYAVGFFELDHGGFPLKLKEARKIAKGSAKGRNRKTR